MNLEELREYCLAKKGVEEGMPFGDTVLVMKVMGKIFALLPLDVEIQTINLKCDPDRAIELREAHPDSIQPGYHMNKAHWNTVSSELGLPKKLLHEMIDHSYELIVASLPKKVRLEWEQL
jgi:predicted DNA-binding protein (MmcQ/YjbR family)